MLSGVAQGVLRSRASCRAGRAFEARRGYRPGRGWAQHRGVRVRLVGGGWGSMLRPYAGMSVWRGRRGGSIQACSSRFSSSNRPMAWA
jgi:hypothetical protein